MNVSEIKDSIAVSSHAYNEGITHNKDAQSKQHDILQHFAALFGITNKASEHMTQIGTLLGETRNAHDKASDAFSTGLEAFNVCREDGPVHARQQESMYRLDIDQTDLILRDEESQKNLRQIHMRLMALYNSIGRLHEDVMAVGVDTGTRNAEAAAIVATNDTLHF